MHFVEDVLKKEGIPDDFKYLAIQEGEFISDAVSTSNAVGFWQFKKASAQELGLRVDNVVDERKHIIASTIGATKYLKRSNFVFDNWVLSLQSYLQGLTGTQRSVADKLYGAKSMNITGKSHWYIKKFIAHKLAFQDYVGEGRKHPEVSLNEFEGKGRTLRQVSKDIKVDYDELKRFNKWLNQSQIPGDKSYKVIYPTKGKQQIIAQNRDNQKPATKPKTNTGTNRTKRRPPVSAQAGNAFRPLEGNVGVYPQMTGNISRAYDAGQIKMNGIPAVRARADENIQSLSRRTGLSMKKLTKFNDIAGNNRFKGDTYYYLKNKKVKGKVHYHVVQQNETLWSIAQDYGIRLNKLRQKNRMAESDQPKVGRVLWLRFIRPQNIPVEYSNVLVAREEVSAEDRLITEASLATAVERSVEKPKAEEVPPSKEENEVFVQPKTIRPLIATETDSIVVHKVKAKETFFAISRIYGVEIDDILEWNQLSIQDGLEVNQEIKLLVPKAKAEVIGLEEVMHEVKVGETLWSISKLYNVTVEDIKKWNDKETNELSPGDRLKILKRP
nr:LysM peptidoglycan-binding domain-containing protein [Roseivirga sp. E12]